MIVSDRALRYSREQQKAPRNLKRMPGYRCFPELQRQREQGFVSNLRGVLELGVALADYQQRGGIRTMQKRNPEKALGAYGSRIEYDSSCSGHRIAERYVRA